MSPKRKWHQSPNITQIQFSHNTNVTKMQMSPICNCYQNVSVNKTQMSPKGKCHQIENVTKTQMGQNWNVTKMQLSPKQKCHQNKKVTETKTSPLGLPFAFIYLPNGSSTTRCPGLVHINPNRLPGYGLSNYRLFWICGLVCAGQILCNKKSFNNSPYIYI